MEWKRAVAEASMALVAFIVVLCIVQYHEADVAAVGGAFVTSLQNTTAPPTTLFFFNIDFPTTPSAAINQDQLRQAIANSLGVPIGSVTLNSLEALAGGGTRVNFQVASPLTEAQTFTNLENTCAGQLAPLGAQCSTLSRGTATAPMSTDDDGSQTAGTIVGAVVGGLVFLGILAGAAFFLFKKPKPIGDPNEFVLVPTVQGGQTATFPGGVPPNSLAGGGQYPQFPTY